MQIKDLLIIQFLLIPNVICIYSGIKRHNNEAIVRRKHDKNRRTANSSPLLKMEVTISGGNRRLSTRSNYSRINQGEVNAYTVQKDNQLIQNVVSNDALITRQHQDNAKTYKPNESSLCKTPHIKKPLNVKTPRSAKSFSARKSTLNSRRTPMKAVLPITPKRQSPRIVLKSTQLSRHMI
jgi:hypothetical protein